MRTSGLCSWCTDDRYTGHPLLSLQVSGIPTLCIIDAETGELISSDGRVLVQQDPAAKLFPWKPTSLQSYLEDDAVNAAGERKPFSDVAGASAAVKALYFSAAWSVSDPSVCFQLSCTLHGIERSINRSDCMALKGLQIVVILATWWEECVLQQVKSPLVFRGPSELPLR